MAILRKNSAYVDNPFTFDDIFNSSLQPRDFNVNWANGEEVYTYRRDGHLYAHDVTGTDTATKLVDSSVFETVGASVYYVSHDRAYVLLGYDRKSIWRYSFRAKYKIYDVANTVLIDFPNDPTLTNTDLQHVSWAPVGHGMVFAKGNNLYYQADPLTACEQATFDGEINKIFNSHSDWVYEEEIFGTHKAFWWSADGTLLCFAKFDDTKVPIFKFPYYGDKTDVYGDIIEVAYPKAGDLTADANTKIALFVMDTANVAGPHVPLVPPSPVSTMEHYVTQVSWRDASTLTVIWSNRVQNQTWTTVCEVASPDCITNFDYTQAGGWIDPGAYVDHIESGAAYLTIHPRMVTGSGFWNHLAHVTSPIGTDSVFTFLTNGEEEIKGIRGFDASKNIVYYLSTSGDPRKRHLYSVGTALADPADQTPVCITCSITDCEYAYASFSTSGKFYLLSCEGPAIPTYRIKSTDGSYDRAEELNTDIANNVNQKSMPTKTQIQIPVGGGKMAWAEILSPMDADNPIYTDSFNMVFNVYGGPGSQAVNLRYDSGRYETYLVSSENIVHVRLDGRGTSSQGNDHKFLIYRSLATVEIEDQILGATYLRDQLNYVNPNNPVGIYGWSYGGFASDHALANESTVFGCGISGAALSDRRFYDTAYTERIMGMASADDNLGGYTKTDITLKVDHIADKKLLIIHGTADDNVHFASAVPFMKALQEKEIQYRLQVYPDQNHYFSSSSPHLYQTYTDFWLKDCWNVGSATKQVQKVLY